MVSLSNLQLTDRNLILTGYIEPNKPRVGRQVAERLQMPFVDMEERIQERLGDTIEGLRERFGERHLKTVEHDFMEEMRLRRRSVLRINGSVLAQTDYLARLNDTSDILCLTARLDAILQKIHVTLGARYHNPAERGLELGKLRREWAVRQRDHVVELDATDMNESQLVDAIVQYWETIATQRR